MPPNTNRTLMSNFRHFFARGMGIVLPTVLTIYLLFLAYDFVKSYIAAPINAGLQAMVIEYTEYPKVTLLDINREMKLIEKDAKLQRRFEKLETEDARQLFATKVARRAKLEEQWAMYAWALDMIGLVVAIVMIYIIGMVLGSYFGRRIYSRGEKLIARVPLIRRVYPSVKQVTDFFVGDNKQQMSQQFNRVVAVQYPRKGLWSLGLVTGSTMRTIQDSAGDDCVTVFIPSSPTPFTGYVITVPRKDTIDLPVTIEEALKFTISLGVLVPPAQEITVEPKTRAPDTLGPDEPRAASI